MGSICYSWSDAPFAWMETPFTWKEACVIDKIVTYGTSKSYLRTKNRIKQLTNDEKQTLIELFVRLEVDEIVFEKNINKHKNPQIKIKLTDVEILMKEQKNIKIDISIIKD